MNATTKKTLRIGLPILLAVFFGWYTFSKLPIDKIIPYFKSANYGWIALGMLLGLLSNLSRAYRWKYLLVPMGYSVKLFNRIMAVFIAYLANFGIPRSGEVLRAAVLTNYEEVPFQKAFGTIIAERMADMIILFSIIAVTLLIQFDFIFELLQTSFQPKKLLIFAAIGIVISILVFVYLKKSQSKIALKVRNFARGLLEGILSIFKMEQKWLFIFHTLFIWIMYVLMFYITTLAVDDLNGVSIGALLIAFIAGSFTIAATNGGIFVYPLAIGAAFSIFDIPENPSIAFGWIMWGSQTLMIIVLGSLSFLFLPVYNAKQKTIKKG
ncbi:lysylphosphatidylglycerol synthase transmembrane domain-containing protein [Gelidibacter sp.]|uniref:lysylphosphatidylglycerol synthase transmembrane domain-containing protein n=1 Tax=Gelidibacter sp. TaxID=2018083 RepID=UPI002C1EE0EA|nr:lysylphosphatidylglycerol synthase transmembrane domain-containing protein [Gelidibacter sp.]HUH29463.1 lysylphosphatidylglycerol synthase transmembrane domain-containing protein [Gelidibacter sp.]